MAEAACLQVGFVDFFSSQVESELYIKQNKKEL